MIYYEHLRNHDNCVAVGCKLKSSSFMFGNRIINRATESTEFKISLTCTFSERYQRNNKSTKQKNLRSYFLFLYVLDVFRHAVQKDTREMAFVVLQLLQKLLAQLILINLYSMRSSEL